MADPFLVTHQVGPSVFDIGGKLYPVSIRDQMVRGQSIVDRAIQAGFGAMGADLLVIGAGAAGATAAIEAASRGITTHLIDSAPLPFLRQAACSTRWIHPHEYEWPLDHWPTPAYPYLGLPAPYYGPVVPLPWSANWSDVLALGWSLRLNRAVASYAPLLSLHYGCRLSAVTPPVFNPLKRQWTVTLDPPGSPTLTVGMILIAVGFGAERVTAPPSFRSLAFWESDPYRSPNCGLALPPRVVISGGGDGSLQDFLRIITGLPSAEEIINYLIPIPIPAAVEAEILSAESRAQRAHLWGSSPDGDHDIHRTLHDAHLRAAAHALTFPAIKAALARLLPAKPPDLKLVHPCTHFSQCYGFNRFLVLLIDAYYQSLKFPPLLIPCAGVAAVTEILPHTCLGPGMVLPDPRRCFGHPHTVAFNSSFHPGCVTARPAPPGPRVADVVIIRHGVTGPAPLLVPALTAIDRPRQSLPIHPSAS
jgi:hypothetical protein